MPHHSPFPTPSPPVACAESFHATAQKTDAASIRIGTVGRIVAGLELGHYVLILPDDGHYILYISHTPEMHDPFDGWMYDMQDVQWYFSHSGWQVEWLTDAAVPQLPAT